MDDELRADWVGRLRSGKYDQGKGHLGQLKDSGQPEFCGLGVLMETLIDRGFSITREDHNMVLSYWWKSPSGVRYQMNTVPIMMIREQIGLSGDVMSTLIRMNDTEHKTFDEIADYIEAEELLNDGTIPLRIKNR